MVLTFHKPWAANADSLADVVCSTDEHRSSGVRIPARMWWIWIVVKEWREKNYRAAVPCTSSRKLKHRSLKYDYVIHNSKLIHIKIVFPILMDSYKWKNPGVLLYLVYIYAFLWNLLPICVPCTKHWPVQLGQWQGVYGVNIKTTIHVPSILFSRSNLLGLA